jgi:predicted aspartyl protease
VAVTVRFDPSRPTIIVGATLAGPSRSITLDLLVDTGASDTIISQTKLTAAGYPPSAAVNAQSVATPAGIIRVLEFRVLVFGTLGQVRTDFPVLAHTFPPGTPHDGVLGLHFMRRNVLTIDFVKAEIDLTPGSPIGPTP